MTFLQASGPSSCIDVYRVILIAITICKKRRKRERGKKKKKKKKAYNTCCSQAVTHPSTGQARRCLTSVIRREPVYSAWYGRRQWKLIVLTFYKVKRGYFERRGYSVGSNIFKTPRAYELYFERYILLDIFYYYSRLCPPTLSSEISVVSEIFEPTE